MSRLALPAVIGLLAAGAVGAAGAPADGAHSVSGRVAVLTFDDACASHARFVGPLLKQYGFGATFFVCEYPGFTNQAHYMTWDEIGQLHRQGFEIGNHTLTHRHVDRMTAAEMNAELDAIDLRCATQGIPRPVSFAYPGYGTNTAALAVLAKRGVRYARAGGGRACRPGEDLPLLIPSVSGSGAGTHRVIEALSRVQPGEVAVLTFHGVPDLAHPKVSVPPETFRVYLDYLRAAGFTVLSMRDAFDRRRTNR